MKKAILVIFASTLFCSSIGFAQNSKLKTAILPSDKVLGEIKFQEQYNPWTPSQADIEEAEKLLNDSFSKSRLEGNINSQRLLENYVRQYFGSIDKDGHKVVWVNCFCDKYIPVNSSSWKTEVYQFNDGGDCFFNLKIDLTEKKYFDFKVNGSY